MKEHNLNNGEVQANVFDKILEPIEQFVTEQEKNLEKHPNQRFSYYEFFRLLMYYFLSGKQSVRLFIKTELKQLPETLRLRQVAYSTFNEAVERFSVKLFRESNISCQQSPLSKYQNYRR